VNELPLLLAGAPPPPLAEPLSGFPAAAREEIESYRRRGALLQALETQLGARRLEVASDLLPRVAAQDDPWLAQVTAQLVSRHSMIGAESERRLLLTRALLVLKDPVIIRAYRQLPPGKLDPKLLQRAGKEALPTDWTAHVLLAQAALDRKDGEAALEHAKEAERRGAPGDRLGQIRGFAHALRGDLDSAEKSFREALAASREGERGEIYYNLGFAREQRKDYPRAIEYQQKSLAEGADPARGKVALARCLRLSGRASEAFTAAEEASQKRESAEAFYEAALALLDLGNPQAALGWMAQAAAAAPERYKDSLERLEKEAK
jgi:tetratricopeptide (TPR) repeat protein